MEKRASEILNEDLENLERKIALIGMADPEKYKFFSGRLKDLQNKILGMTETKFDEMKFAVIKEMTELQVSFDAYMTGSDYSELTNQELSGKAKIKKYKIGLYQSIASDMKKLDEIDIDRLRQLREKWNEEEKDEYIKYIAVEKSAIEETISDVFLEYQIKYARKNKRLPEDKISDYTSYAEYKARIQERLIAISQDEKRSASDKLELSEMLNIGELSDLLKNKRFWEILTSTKIAVEPKRVEKMLGVNKEKEPEESNLPMVIEEPKKGKRYATGVIKKKGLFGKEKEKIIKVRVKGDDFYLPDKYKDKLVSISIPEGVTRIAYEALSNCPILESVSIPSTVVRIGQCAFENSTALRKINLPDALKFIEEKAFRNCENLEDVNIHSGIERIESYAFENTAIKQLNLENNNFSIKHEGYYAYNLGTGVFKDCKSLERVVLPKDFTYIPNETFRGCWALSDIKFSENLTRIGEQAFYGCSSITELMNLPDTVENMGRGCFKECSNLRRFRLPAFLKELGMAFDTTAMFDEVILPRQLMNLKLLNDLKIKERNEITIPEDAQGYLYDKLNVEPGEKVSLFDLRFRASEILSQKSEIIPERETYVKYGPRNRSSVRSREKVPPTIIAVEKDDTTTTDDLDGDEQEL